MKKVRYSIHTTDGRWIAVQGTAVGPYLAVREVRVPGWGTVWAVDHTPTGASAGCYGTREVAFDIADRIAPVSDQLGPNVDTEKVVGRALIARIRKSVVRDERNRAITSDAVGVPA